MADANISSLRQHKGRRQTVGVLKENTVGILDSFRLDGKTALVTGGGTGIGKAFAIALAEAGADVALIGRRSEPLEEVSKLIDSLGCKAMSISADVKSKTQVDDFTNQVVSEWGKLDIGVNNAGICFHTPTNQIEESEWDEVIDTNLKGPFLCAQAQARVMIPNSYGKIINTASMSGRIINRPQFQTHYNTSKAGLVHLTHSLATEWAEHGIYVNSISPGYIRTDMADTPEIAKMHPVWLRDTPVNRLGEVQDLTGALIFLASDASNFVIGHDLVIDGGFTAW